MTATPEEVEALRAENLALKAKLERSLHTIEIYKSMLFGRSSEKRRPAPGESNPNQGHLFSADLLQDAERTAEVAPIQVYPAMKRCWTNPHTKSSLKKLTVAMNKVVGQLIARMN